MTDRWVEINNIKAYQTVLLLVLYVSEPVNSRLHVFPLVDVHQNFLADTVQYFLTYLFYL